MNQKHANTIVHGTKHAFSLAIQSWCVGAGGLKKNASGSQKDSSGIIQELGAIVGLKQQIEELNYV